MTMRSKDIWLPIYDQVHEHLRYALRRRDQIIAFYLLLLAALISAWGKLSDIQSIVVALTWAIGLICFFVLAQYWRWQIVLHLSLVTILNLMAFSKNPSIKKCEKVWNKVNITDYKVWTFMNPRRGVEAATMYLFALMTFVPGYLVYRKIDFAIIRLESESVAFLLDAIIYTIFLVFCSALFVKKFTKFDRLHWMFRWISGPGKLQSLKK